HPPHSRRDPKPIADWIEQNSRPLSEVAPPFAGAKYTRSSYYSTESRYLNFPSEAVFVTCRGPGFVDSFNRYQFSINGVEGGITIVAPKQPAPNLPWVFRSDLLERDATVDLALLAKGFHIVTGPVHYNADGPNLSHWNAVYQHLVECG